jgi:hypothetical protein
VAGSILAAGCLDSDTEIALANVGIINWADEGNSVELHIERDGTPVYDNVHTLGPFEAEDGSDTTIIRDLPEEQGKYHLIGSITSHKDQPRAEPALDYKPQTDVDSDCRTISLTLYMDKPPWDLATTTYPKCETDNQTA